MPWSLWWFQPVSWFLGIVDYSVVVLNTLLGRARPKFFARGWGNLEPVYAAQQNLLEILAEGDTNNALRLTDNEINWDASARSESHILIRQGQFVSPLAHLLPKASHACSFALVEPKSNNKKDVYVIMLPATGEMGTRERLAMARQLATRHGYSSLIITAPFYGPRKPLEQNLFFISTVSNLLLQSQAIIHETTTLAQYLLNKSPSTKVCITGFSWGAAMSSCASAAMSLLLGNADGGKRRLDGKRLACVPYVGCASPVILVDGMLSDSIDWSALEPDIISNEPSTRKALCEELNKSQLAIFTKPFQEQSLSRIGAVRAACMNHDHFIRRPFSEDFLQQLEGLTGRESIQASWYPGGHVLAALMRSFIQQGLVVKAVDALEKAK